MTETELFFDKIERSPIGTMLISMLVSSLIIVVFCDVLNLQNARRYLIYTTYIDDILR